MLIEARNVSLVYDIEKENDSYALKDISFTVKPHELVGVMGPSGSGKSSLLYVLSGLKKPTTGSVYYDDQDVDAFGPDDLSRIRRQRYGFVFQRHLLVDYLSVLDNVLLPCFHMDDATIERAQALLERMEIRHLQKKRPGELSQGQRQRVAVTRALINKPDVIFADEPTASLDHKNAMDVMAVFEEQLENTAVIVVTHDGSILEHAGRIVELWDGRIKKG